MSSVQLVESAPQNKKTALVTGGSRGIGTALCRVLAASGQRVLINYKDGESAAARVRQDILDTGGQADIVRFDVSDRESVVRGLDEIGSPGIDLLVNNAGILRDSLVSSLAMEDWRRVIETNFLGALNVYAATEHLLANSVAPTIVNIASIAGFAGGKGQAAYATSKAMLIAWTESLAQMAQREGSKLRAFAIAPGAVATDMVRNSPIYNDPRVLGSIPSNRFANPDEMGDLLSFIVTNRSVLANGSMWVADGGFTLSPK